MCVQLLNHRNIVVLTHKSSCIFCWALLEQASVNIIIINADMKEILLCIDKATVLAILNIFSGYQCNFTV